MGKIDSHVALARRLWQAGAAGDAEAFYALYAPAAVLRAPGTGPIGGEFTGVPAILGFLARCADLVDDLRSELIDIYASEAGAVIRYRTTAERGPRQLDLEYLLELRIENGRVVEATLVPKDQNRSDEFWQLD